MKEKKRRKKKKRERKKEKREREREFGVLNIYNIKRCNTHFIQFT